MSMTLVMVVTASPAGAS